MNLFNGEVWFQSFGSGSSGNCYFVGNHEYGILIDAGLSSRATRKYLKNIGLDIKNIRAIFVTHDHTDHVKGVAGLGEHFLIPVFATPETHRGIENNSCIAQTLDRSKCFLHKGQNVDIEDFKVTAFHISHDATDSVGYFVEFCGKTFTFATDLGEVGSEAAKYLQSSDYVILEANYDDEMLRNGKYPIYLQNRIRAVTGHLSNEQTGIFLSENFSEKWQKIFLCHLSKENNTKELAVRTVSDFLLKNNKLKENTVEVVALNRTLPSKLYIL
ncbi:MAG: MBL fold metallo-hydrolase [Prevotellaceae bacterium]|jgi:phosphoribosyl 1,2-cyclic phosphodiesterase|nr:MBL fold metallo-hydrolase [Prevotellaceae bacterium]